MRAEVASTEVCSFITVHRLNTYKVADLYE